MGTVSPAQTATITQGAIYGASLVTGLVWLVLGISGAARRVGRHSLDVIPARRNSDSRVMPFRRRTASAFVILLSALEIIVRKYFVL
jgi:hypothetical protein